MEHTDEIGLLRIGQLSRRSGVSDHLLRAWESRYGLLRPVRSAGGFRLYSAADERRVRRMTSLLESGLSAAQAAGAALAQDGFPDASLTDTSPADTSPADAPLADESRSEPDRRAAVPDRPAAPSGDLPAALDELGSALDAYDEGTAQAVLDRLLAEFTVTTVLRAVLIPYLHQLGDRWQRGSASVAQEHFASNIIRGRLAGLARGWGAGTGPRALLACPPDEQHDLALMAFGVVLSRSGWRIGFLGAGTPIAELVGAAAAVDPALTVVAATASERFEVVADDLASLAARTPLAIAGAGAGRELADRIGARLLTEDPVTAAEALAGQPR